jgi:hypothetical protein
VVEIDLAGEHLAALERFFAEENTRVATGPGSAICGCCRGLDLGCKTRLYRPGACDGNVGVADDVILVFTPQFFFELSFAQVFQLSFNFGITIRVPHQLILLDGGVYY